MGITVNTNIAAIGAYQNLDKTSDAFNTSLQRLSSGMKINTAADDAAGYVISQQLQRQSNAYGVAINNAQDGVSVLQTAQGALNQTTSILQRMNELAMRAANGTNNDNTARTADQQEFKALQSQMDQIANSTVFGGASLLNGTYNATFQVGTDASANSVVNVNVAGGIGGAAVLTGASAPTLAAITSSNNLFSYSVDGVAKSFTLAVGPAPADANALAAQLTTGAAGDFTASVVGGKIVLTGATIGTSSSITLASGNTAGTLTGIAASATASGTAPAAGKGFSSTDLGVGSLDISTQQGASSALLTVKNALDQVTQAQATMGAAQNRLTVIAANLGVGQQNLQAANSRLVDTDMAQEMTTFSSKQILKQVGTAMLAQAQQAPQTILKLIG